MKRILVIRGGAIGDFVLTLPMLAALREGFPRSRIEILGYKHIVALAERRFYADAVRSIEYGALASFFAKGSELSPELADYFRSFDLIISYLFDPDRHFQQNLMRCGAEEFLAAPHKVTGPEHAAKQLAAPLDPLGLDTEDYAARLHPSDADRAFAEEFLRGVAAPIIALHPGSGSEVKNWPMERWLRLIDHLWAKRPTATPLAIGGEADTAQLTAIRSRPNESRIMLAENLPLPQLAAVLARCTFFLGHDSGISHIAAATGIPCLLLFGPTDPRVWAPLNPRVHVVSAPSGKLPDLDFEAVASRLDQELMRIGIST